MALGPVSKLDELAAKYGGEALAFGLGVALGAALQPESTGIRQDQWSADPNVAVDPGTAAAIAAERASEYDWASGEAVQHGLADVKFQKLYEEALNAPGFGELIRMLRRGTITADAFVHGLNKAKLEDQWNVPLEELRDERLDPAVIADGIQRRVAPDPGYLEGALPVDGSDVPILSVASIDPVKEAAAAGIDSDRLGFLTKISGLPPSPGELLQLLNRGSINEAAFALGVSQGHTRNEWGPALLTLRRRLLTPHEYEEAALRGIITNAAADAGAALSGMETADAQLLFEIMGRPLAVHQITTGLARGGEYGGTYDDIPEPYRDAVRRSNIRPEYARLAFANRYTIPSYFILRAILQDGGMTEADFAQYGKDLGWPPDLADKAAAAISGGTGSKGDTHVTKAQTQLWTALHKAYVDGRAPATAARTTLDTLGVTATSTDEVLKLWDAEKALYRTGLSATEIRKAVGQPGKDTVWATGRLRELGWDDGDAATFLAE